jgi:prepilin-type N-terminal cleavage/methylation domain-containing protein
LRKIKILIFRKGGEKMTTKNTKGFTLLELLIVIAILAVLSVALVLVLNPAESLRKSRDVQRMSDLATLKTAIGLYLTTVSSPDLDGAGGFDNKCLNGVTATAQIAYSSIVADPLCNVTVAPGSDTSATFAGGDMCYTAGATALTVTAADGTGWLPVNFGLIAGGSPISSLPIDPSNTSIGSTPTSADLVYRYACQSVGVSGKPSNVFEINAVLESDYYKVGGTDDRSAKDGGDNANYYEVGTSTRLIGGAGNPTNF